MESVSALESVMGVLNARAQHAAIFCSISPLLDSLPAKSVNLAILFASEQPWGEDMFVALFRTVKTNGNAVLLFRAQFCGTADLIAAHTIETKFKHIHLRNRIVVPVSGGGYLVALWYTRGDDYVFNLDPVRIPAKYPGKRSSTTGKLSGNPLGKNPSDVWDFEDGANDEVVCESTVRRLVLALSNPDDVVLCLDPRSSFNESSWSGRRAICIENTRADAEEGNAGAAASTARASAVGARGGSASATGGSSRRGAQ
ncbi:MAG TPA: hypothetical protein VKP88_00360 [Candidatus Paceibacterota bacterium]|nr:hypothetical protein [Candidatus Paceibacterota bacterium]